MIQELPHGQIQRLRLGFATMQARASVLLLHMPSGMLGAHHFQRNCPSMPDNWCTGKAGKARSLAEWPETLDLLERYQFHCSKLTPCRCCS